MAFDGMKASIGRRPSDFPSKRVSAQRACDCTARLGDKPEATVTRAMYRAIRDAEGRPAPLDDSRKVPISTEQSAEKK